MEHFVALDVSLKEISVCILDGKGGVVFEGRTAADPSVLVELIRAKAPDSVRVGLETGATTPWLFHSLAAAGLPVVCMDARHASAALSMRPRKSDRSDARGLADILRMGWYREVRAKSFSAHERRALLATRHRLVTIRTELDAQLRGLLKTFGLVVGPGNTDVLVRKAEALSEGLPVMKVLVSKLAEVRRHVVLQVGALDRDIRRLVRNDEILRRFMTVPGVGPVTAVAFLSTIDDPGRFRHARDVGPYLGLTPTRYQSGETDRQGRISKCGDAFTRSCLYEAANVLLTKVERFSPLKAWGMRLAKRVGGKKARIAVAQNRHHPAMHLDRRHRVLVDPSGDQDGLTLTPPHQLRSGGGAVSAGTVGDGDREESVGRYEAHLGPGRLRHSGATPLTPIMGRPVRPRREP